MSPGCFTLTTPWQAPFYSWGLRGLGSPRQPTGGFGKSLGFLVHGVAHMDKTLHPLGRKTSPDPVTHLAAPPILSEEGYQGQRNETQRRKSL